MKHKVLIAVSAAVVLLAAVLVIFWSIGATKTVAAVGEIRLDKRTIELRVKEEIIKGKGAELDDVVLLLARDRYIMNKLKGTSQRITKGEREEMRRSAQEGYRKSKEANTSYFDRYGISEEDSVDILVAMRLRAVAEKRYMELMRDELLSEYAKKHGAGPLAGDEPLDELFAEHLEQLLADFEPPVWNEEEKETLKAEAENFYENVYKKAMLHSNHIF